ncbi:MAG: ORF6N domain-containing protein [Candidatus Saganbacteria bacterium]|nr:ORF6N domain-containing protein [Candidatus Saganbacteria bacterium]
MPKSAIIKQRLKNIGVEKSNNLIISAESIEGKIFLSRGRKVILDADLASFYGVSTGRLNEQVKRNIKRFPEDFMFQLTQNEYLSLQDLSPDLISQNAMSSYGGRRHYPFVFTEQGIAMLSGILNSERAIMVNIAIMRAFVKIRQIVSFNKELAQKFAELERTVDRHDKDIIDIFRAINKIIKEEQKPKAKFGFI